VCLPHVSDGGEPGGDFRKILDDILGIIDEGCSRHFS
jgi:hypothetical protein